MSPFDDLSTESKKVNADQSQSELIKASHSLYREAEMIGFGVAGAVVEIHSHPLNKLPELIASFATGSALGAISRLGAPGRAVAAGIGTAMLVKFGYDELTGKRWSRFGSALKDTWSSADNLEQNIEITKTSLGTFLVDTGIGYAGMKMSALAMSRFAPPAKLITDVVNRADVDGGAALRDLEDRWENPTDFQRNAAAGQLELIAYSQPAVPGEARGDLIMVATNREGNVLLSAMDVEGHGTNAAKKAVTVHAAFDEVLPRSGDKSASDMLDMIDHRLSTKDELSITAAMMKYNPATHNLETATASSELAFVVRADGTVHPLGADVVGLGLGTDMYSMLPSGNEVINLGEGDTVIVASDGVGDRFGWGDTAVKGFESFLTKTGPNPEVIRKGILDTPPVEEVDDTSFMIFRRPLSVVTTKTV